jgi:hypothetical protein
MIDFEKFEKLIDSPITYIGAVLVIGIIGFSLAFLIGMV